MRRVKTIRQKKINKEDGSRKSKYTVTGVFQKRKATSVKNDNSSKLSVNKRKPEATLKRAIISPATTAQKSYTSDVWCPLTYSLTSTFSQPFPNHFQGLGKLIFSELFPSKTLDSTLPDGYALRECHFNSRILNLSKLPLDRAFPEFFMSCPFQILGGLKCMSWW